MPSSRRKKSRNNSDSVSNTNSSANTTSQASSADTTNTNTDIAVQELSTCPSCGHDVPTSNLILHEANCNRSSAQPASSESHESNSNTQISTPSQQHPSIPNNNQRSSNDNFPEEETATFVGNIRPPSQTTTQSTTSSNNITEASSRISSDQIISTGAVQLDHANQWQCSRCTLINENSDANCNACLAPRNATTTTSATSSTTVRPPDETTTQRLIGNNNNNNDEVVDNGWVNVTYNPQFQRGRNAAANNNNNLFNINMPDVPNPLVQTGPLSTISRVLNGILNGAIVGSVFGGPTGMIVGGVAGAVGGAMVDRARNREANDDIRETHNVANMLATDNGGISANTVRVHRTSDYITALSRDRSGRNRVIRVRYNEPRPHQHPLSGRDEVLRQRVHDSRSQLERSLLDILVQMSYSNDYGPGPGDNVILQPEESFEELIARFGLGTENRGAQQSVIDSYPVEVVRASCRSKGGEDGKKKHSDENNDGNDESSRSGDLPYDHVNEDDETDETKQQLGTCGICLEDYKEGELKKTLGCPHSFHKDCIDKWLKLVASCPTCKQSVSMQRAT